MYLREGIKVVKILHSTSVTTSTPATSPTTSAMTSPPPNTWTSPPCWRPTSRPIQITTRERSESETNAYPGPSTSEESRSRSQPPNLNMEQPSPGPSRIQVERSSRPTGTKPKKVGSRYFPTLAEHKRQNPGNRCPSPKSDDSDGYFWGKNGGYPPTSSDDE